MLAKRAWLVLLAAVCAGYFYHLGAFPLLGPDEPRYAQVAREMFERGDWVTPTLGGLAWFEKPALLYWLMIAAYSVFGVTEFAARAGSALAGVCVVLLAGWMGARVERESGGRVRGLGLACAAVTASGAGLMVFAHAATFDILLTATLAAALASFFASEIERDARKRRRLLAGFYAGVGASLLAKGLVGVVLAGGVVLAYHLLRRRLPNPLKLGAWWGLLVTAAIAALWYGPVWFRHGRDFFDAFILQHHFARYLSNKYSHPQPFWFYLPITLLLALPWTFFFVRGLWAARAVNWRAEDAETKFRALALAWVLVPVIFFSLSGSKLPGYVLPALPGALLLAGERVHQYLRGGGELLTMRLTGLTALLLFAAGVTYALTQFGWTPDGARPALVPAWCVAAIVAPAGIAAVAAFCFARRRELAFVSVAGGTLLTVALLAACAAGPAARSESIAPLLAAADAEGHGTLPVWFMRTPERTSQFYAAGRLTYEADGEVRVLDEPEDLTRAVGGAQTPALLVVPLEFEYMVTGAEQVRERRLGDNGGHALFRVSGEGEK